jgi:hypothetical protein
LIRANARCAVKIIIVRIFAVTIMIIMTAGVKT